ncbi:hypothetical protein DWW31_01435 [Clostridium sp. AF15-17LB]|nr:hypothetical protein DWW31_01435 [Clostridium sp. AF15-17LB]
MAALTPQAKESGEISPSLPLIPAHLSHTSPSAIYFTSMGGGGCVALSADGRALLCQHIDSLSPLAKRNYNIRRAGIRYGDVYEITSPAWFRLFLQQRRVRLAANA